MSSEIRANAIDKSSLTVVAWHKKPRDIVYKDEVLVELESATNKIEITAGQDGWLSYEHLIMPGSIVESGDVIGLLLDSPPPPMYKLRSPHPRDEHSTFNVEWKVEEETLFKVGTVIAVFTNSEASQNLVAPFDGMIANLQVNSGDEVQPNAVLGALIQSDSPPSALLYDTPNIAGSRKRTVRLMAKTPDVNEPFCEILWHFNQGDYVKKNQILMAFIAGGKVVHVEAPFDGVLIEQFFQTDELVKPKEPVALFEQQTKRLAQSPPTQLNKFLHMTAPEIPEGLVSAEIKWLVEQGALVKKGECPFAFKINGELIGVTAPFPAYIVEHVAETGDFVEKGMLIGIQRHD